MTLDSKAALSEFLRKYSPAPQTLLEAFERLRPEGIIEKNDGDSICAVGDQAEQCWLILKGNVSVHIEGQLVTTRTVGELVGEQAFLKSLVPSGTAHRTATLMARGNTSLLCIDWSFHDRLNPAERASWFLTLASVANEKLEQATKARAQLTEFISNRNSLLKRFADEAALAVVQLAVDRGENGATEREVIVWFSDIAQFSAWALGKPPAEVARVARILLEVQIAKIRSSGGDIDKLMGDGLMAYWFIDTADRRTSTPAKAFQCAQEVVAEIEALLSKEGLSDLLDIRIGMHCGPVAFGDFGAADRIAVTVLGPVVNTAARYEQAKSERAKLGRIRISPELRQAIENCSVRPSICWSEPVEIAVKHDRLTVFSI
jgi:class 3 adenylate cyclase